MRPDGTYGTVSSDSSSQLESISRDVIGGFPSSAPGSGRRDGFASASSVDTSRSSSLQTSPLRAVFL